MARVEQHLPDALLQQSLIEVVLARLPASGREQQRWQAERLLAEMGFTTVAFTQRAATLSGGQHTRLLLARALIQQPDLPCCWTNLANHLDLPTLLWLESFLQTWQGVSCWCPMTILLDAVTNASWILRDRTTLHAFSLPCSAARQALAERDESDALRHKAEQREIDRVTTSAKRLAAGTGVRQRRSRAKPNRWRNRSRA